MEPRSKTLLDQACTELVEVSAKSSAGNTTPFAKKGPAISTHSTMPSPKSKSGRRFGPPARPILRHLSSEHQILVPPPGRLCTLSVAPIIAARSCIPVRP